MDVRESDFMQAKNMRCPACGYTIAIKSQFNLGGFSHAYALILTHSFEVIGYVGDLET